MTISRNTLILGGIVCLGIVVSGMFYLGAGKRYPLTTGWSRHVDEKWQYQIDYPSSVSFDVDPQGNTGDLSWDETRSNVSIFAWSLKSGQWHPEFPPNIHLAEQKILIDGYDAYQLAGKGTGGDYFVTTLIRGPHYLYEVQYSDSRKNATDSVLFREIFSTFHFAE